MRLLTRKRRTAGKAWVLPLIAYGLAFTYCLLRPQPRGVNTMPASYRLPVDAIDFFHDTTWYEQGERRAVRQIAPELLRIIGIAREFVVLDVFLFSLHHLPPGDTNFVPTTRQICHALAAINCPKWFITDPINTSYGSTVSPPLHWLEQAGVTVCVTDIRQLRDSNLVYAPLWRLLLQWVGNNSRPRLKSPFEYGATVTLWSMLEAINARGNHRKVLIAGVPDGYTTLVTSSNFEDSSSYFGNTAVTIRSASVARHYLAAEKGVARISGIEIPVQIAASAEREREGDALVTPLHGAWIKRAIIQDLDCLAAGDRLWVCAQFLSHREVIEALVAASRRGVHGTIVLDQNKVSFGNPKNGFPNQLTGPEIVRRTNFTLRWANTEKEEYHNQFIFIERGDLGVLHVGSANFSRRNLSNTVLEANARVQAPANAAVCKKARAYVHWLTQAPRSLPYESDPWIYSWPAYCVYRVQEALGIGKF